MRLSGRRRSTHAREAFSFFPRNPSRGARTDQPGRRSPSVSAAHPGHTWSARLFPSCRGQGPNRRRSSSRGAWHSSGRSGLATGASRNGSIRHPARPSADRSTGVDAHAPAPRIESFRFAPHARATRLIVKPTSNRSSRRWDPRRATARFREGPRRFDQISKPCSRELRLCTASDSIAHAAPECTTCWIVKRARAAAPGVRIPAA
jgi:hypothetical protein